MALTVETESRIYRGLRAASGAAAHLVALGFTVFVAVLARPGSSKWGWAGAAGSRAGAAGEARPPSRVSAGRTYPRPDPRHNGPLPCRPGPGARRRLGAHPSPGSAHCGRGWAAQHLLVPWAQVARFLAARVAESGGPGQAACRVVAGVWQDRRCWGRAEFWVTETSSQLFSLLSGVRFWAKICSLIPLEFSEASGRWESGVLFHPVFAVSLKNVTFTLLRLSWAGLDFT
ncbi:transmembrane reductase CYB561D2 isoform X1 [Macrotis lagotis]|uniref:transmembrane reductase CYB561D2 isoform X1 n=1 Tax=Macrotis lagotis TaxID=92651 RepID=UPI003D68625D